MSWGDTFNRNKATGMDPSAAAFIADQSEPARKRKLEEKNMTAAQQVEPYGYAFQHEETGLQQVVDVQQVEWGFEKNNPRWQKLGPVYLHPPAPQMRGLKHPEYAHGISDVELIKEALAFCDEELDAYEGLEYDDDCEVCCQRSNTFIRELVHRLEVANVATPASAPQVKPDYWAIHSATGIHIGLWPDKADADEALREYEGGTITPLYRAPPPAPQVMGSDDQPRYTTARLQLEIRKARNAGLEEAAASHINAAEKIRDNPKNYLDGEMRKHAKRSIGYHERAAIAIRAMKEAER